MGFIDRIKLILGREGEPDNSPIFYPTIGSAFSEENSTQISTVYTCIKILGDTVSRLPLGVYHNGDQGRLKDKEHYLYDILHYNPNNYTTSQAFFAALEVARNLKGNAFARIHRKKATGMVESLEIIPVSRIKGYNVTNGNLYYKVAPKDSDKTDTVNSVDMLHFKMISRDGIWGINPIEALRLNLSSSWEGMRTIEAFYRNNGINPKAIKSTVSGANQKMMLEALEKFKTEFTGSANAGKIIPLPPNTEIQELQMNTADAAFIATFQFNANQIAALYGIPPHLVGNFEASKFNNVEQLQLNFKVNSISAIARMYRQELEFKLLTTAERKAGKSIEFALGGLVETDYKTRLEGHKTLANIGVVTPNAIARMEGFETYEAGDDHYIMSNMQSVEVYKKKQEFLLDKGKTDE